MNVFELMTPHGYEQIAFCHDAPTGLKAIICIHNTQLGPGLGGTRFYPYPTDEAALVDVVRLARAMSYKNAGAGLNAGGGKAVIIGDPARLRGEAFLRAYGRFVHSLNGRYLTTTDVGTITADLDVIREETPYVTGCSPAFGGGGDTSVLTGLTVYLGMKAAAKHAFGTDSLSGRRIAIQGAGKVGYYLMKNLVQEQPELLVTDVNPAMVDRAAKEFGAKPYDGDIVAAEADILAPCALGAVINDETIPRIRAKVICGGANNQLADEEKHADALERARILHAPDYIVNSGGVINAFDEIDTGGYNLARAEARARRVYDTTDRILATAKAEAIPPLRAADRYAEARMEAISQVHRMYAGAG
jgi:leucine dehydrogenase